MSAIAPASAAAASRITIVDLFISTISTPVLPHQLGRPSRLADGAAWQELGHHRLDVHDRRTVHGVEPLDLERPAAARHDANDRGAQQVRPAAGPPGEDADARPRRGAARVARTA